MNSTSTLRGPTVNPTPTPPIADHPLIARGRAALRELLRLVADRAAAEAEVAATFAAADANAERGHAERRRLLDEKYRTLTTNAVSTDEARRRQIVDDASAAEAEAKQIFARASRKFAAEFDAAREKAKSDHARARSRATAEYESAQKEAAARLVRDRKEPDEMARLVATIRLRLAAVFEDYRQFGLVEAATVPLRGAYRPDDPLDKAFDRLHKQESELDLLEGLIIPKAMKGRRAFWLAPLLFAPATAALWWLQGPSVGVPAGAGVAAVGTWALRSKLFALSKNQVGKLYYPIAQVATDAEGLANHHLARVEEQAKLDRANASARHEDSLLKAKQQMAGAIAAAEAERDERLRQINEVFARSKVETQTRMAQQMGEAVADHARRQAELPQLYQAGSKKLDDKYRELKDAARSRRDLDHAALATRWRDGMARVRLEVDALNAEVAAIGPAWDGPSDAEPPLSTRLPTVLRFGESRVDLADLPDGLPTDPSLMIGIDPAFAFPALTPFPDRANLLVETPAADRPAALARLQAAMARLLTSLPPGQVRFTIVDPVGIGRAFGAFLHLADHDEALITGQVWTDPRQIDERLADLQAHMEKVTQKYLRDEYASIDEYNAAAGEVAEPYRVLVVADYPAGLDERSTARLAAIAASGVPCGVLTLASRDLDRPLPQGAGPDDLRPHALVLRRRDDGWDRADPDFDPYPFLLDPPPSGESAARLIRRIGVAAAGARRVEVPFSYIAPMPEGDWTRDSRSGLDVALGKSGPGKRQHLALGKGTAQHALVAGRTGSGKSTLMHALIVNLALNYSPDEVELYLIDFKKGVEFKVYASHALPHAAVVAIESEREFGISVLQRLDAELRARADRFRDAGVQDVRGFRDLSDSPPLPRIVLLVDEFQEFFVEEDKLAQEAALLLDRLVRQGRAFGVHLVLGSQSLGGAYALARTTLGQFAIRIALQCSEADAHLILGEQNDAARHLARPGEAIYNDQNGQAEANHFFQVVWLPDDARESYLGRIAELAQAHPIIRSRPAIVFEGDARAEPARNPRLAALLDAPTWPETPPRPALAWLGDAVAIKDPTSAPFRRQGGDHLLLVGQSPESALGVIAAAIVALAAQFPPANSENGRRGARFVILDGTPEDDPEAGRLARLASALPHPVEVGDFRDAAGIVAALAEDVATRQTPEGRDGPEVFLIIHDLGRFRDLRRREDDFGFGRSGDEPSSPSDSLLAIVREGSALGLHALIWSDNLANLNRAFDNQALREFESRVLFQMGAGDSAHLLDAPHASKLGPNRALYAREGVERLEKFRPYGPPDEDWIEQVRSKLGNRTIGEG